jgi:hypothetical protein
MQMSETVMHEGGRIARSNRFFFSLGQVGEVDEKGKTIFAMTFKGKRVADPDRPLALIVGFIHNCIVTKFAYSSPEECAKDIAILKEYVNGLESHKDDPAAEKTA